MTKHTQAHILKTQIQHLNNHNQTNTSTRTTQCTPYIYINNFQYATLNIRKHNKKEPNTNIANNKTKSQNNKNKQKQNNMGTLNRNKYVFPNQKKKHQSNTHKPHKMNNEVQTTTQ